jgi:hypothetical protein
MRSEPKHEGALPEALSIPMAQHPRPCQICRAAKARNLPRNDRNELFDGATVFSKATRFDYLKLPQKRWMRLQASSRSEVLVA